MSGGNGTDSDQSAPTGIVRQENPGLDNRNRPLSESRTKRDSLVAIINREIPAQQRIRIVARLARGTRTRSTDGTFIYKTLPNLAAVRFLEEYATGKPVQAMEIGSDDGFACIIVPSQKQRKD